MAHAKSRTLFSVVEAIGQDGKPFLCVEWHPDLFPALDYLAPNEEITDLVISIAEELTALDEPDEDETE